MRSFITTAGVYERVSEVCAGGGAEGESVGSDRGHSTLGQGQTAALSVPTHQEKCNCSSGMQITNIHVHVHVYVCRLLVFICVYNNV